MDKTFISFGPNCLAADILKQSKLRRATYGFDWCRSGSWHHREFLLSPIDEFMSAYVYRPSVSLWQPMNPRLQTNKTVELKARRLIYGYQTLYNPHRHLYNKENRDYFKRCFTRLKNALTDEKSERVILMADYDNKPGNSIIKDKRKALSYINNLLKLKSVKHRLIFINIILKEDTQTINKGKIMLMSGEEAKELTLEIDPVIDSNTTKRRKILSQMAKYLIE